MPQQHNTQPKLANLRQHLVSLLQLSSALDAGGLHTLTTVIERLSTFGDLNLQAHQANPLSDLLPQIEHATVHLPEHCQHMVNSVIALTDDLPWYQRPVANNPSFMAGHVNAQIIGPEGLDVMHGMKSVNTPLIALWCLPLDKPFASFSPSAGLAVGLSSNSSAPAS
jgi:hypothetical protein